MVLQALQLQTPTTTLSRISNVNKNFFIFFEHLVAFGNAVKQYIQVRHAGVFDKDTSFAVFGLRAHVNADAFTVRNVLYERQELLEFRRPSAVEGVCPSRNDEVRVLKRRVLKRFLLEGEGNRARHRFARRAVPLEGYCYHFCSGFCNDSQCP